MRIKEVSSNKSTYIVIPKEKVNFQTTIVIFLTLLYSDKMLFNEF